MEKRKSTSRPTFQLVTQPESIRLLPCGTNRADRSMSPQAGRDSILDCREQANALIKRATTLDIYVQHVPESQEHAVAKMVQTVAARRHAQFVHLKPDVVN